MSTAAASFDRRSPSTAAGVLRAGVIGLGVGEAHAAGYAAHPGSRLVGVCDLDAERAAAISAVHAGSRVYAGADELLDDPGIDVVSIASYDCDHYAQIVRAIGAGKHVFVEKPLCLSLDETRHIRALLRENPDVRLSSNLVLRASPRFVALKGRIERGELGELFCAEGDYCYGRLHKITEGWRGAIEYYSVVYGGAIHIVDLLMWLTGSRIVEVAAFGNQVASRGSQFRFNDTVVASLRFACGVIGKVGVSYGCMRPHFHNLSIYGTAATFINAAPDAMLYDSRDPQAPPHCMREAYPGVRKDALIGGFIESIARGAPAPVSEADVFDTMSVCFAIEQSVQTGAACAVEFV